jgi:hypothetical protein
MKLHSSIDQEPKRLKGRDALVQATVADVGGTIRLHKALS